MTRSPASAQMLEASDGAAIRRSLVEATHAQRLEKGKTAVDGSGFDRWVKRVGTAFPRRRALTGVAVGLAAPLVRLVAPEAEAGKRKRQCKCPDGPSCVPNPPGPSCPTCPSCPACRSGEDFCAGDGSPPCGANCRCLRRLVGGDTICASLPTGIQCEDCTTDAHCSAIVPGAFCANGSGPNCCNKAGAGFCALPCSS